MDDASRAAPSKSTASGLAGVVGNVPNRLTIARLCLAIVCFAFLGSGAFRVSLWLFLIAAGTDWVDGYWARRFDQVTHLGRILDPFADKFIICGVFVFLSAIPNSAIAPWMTVVVVARELLVTGLRSFFEQRGIDFSASQSGKWKMLTQCLAVALSLYRLTYWDGAIGAWGTIPPVWLTTGLHLAVWSAVVMTLYSGWGYVNAALKLLRDDQFAST